MEEDWTLGVIGLIQTLPSEPFLPECLGVGGGSPKPASVPEGMKAELGEAAPIQLPSERACGLEAQEPHSCERGKPEGSSLPAPALILFRGAGLQGTGTEPPTPMPQLYPQRRQPAVRDRVLQARRLPALLSAFAQRGPLPVGRR